MFETRTGNTLSSSSSEAAGLYQEAVDLILGSESGAAETLDRALELDNDFALAAAARYYVAQDVGDPDSLAFRELAERAALHATDWEREHIGVLIGLIDLPDATLAKALAYLDSTPNDLLVISQLTGNLFFYGGPNKLDAVLNVLESVEPALGDDWAYLARLGFAASEAGQRKRGRELIERSLEIRPQALYSIHGLAHVLHDDGVAAESAKLLQDWLSVHESGAREGQMYGHVQWHLALAEWRLHQRRMAHIEAGKHLAAVLHRKAVGAVAHEEAGAPQVDAAREHLVGAALVADGEGLALARIAHGLGECDGEKLPGVVLGGRGVAAAEDEDAAAFAEEVLWRGYFQNRLCHWIGAHKGIIIAAILFGLGHLLSIHAIEGYLDARHALPTFIQTSSGGLILGYLFYWSRSILPGAILHLFGNAFLFKII